MTARWWTPDGPGADAFDVALATQGEDLAGPFLALHRVGAAACQEAADTPLVDESVLVDKIDSAQQLTEVLLDVRVSKDAYGDLLAADLMDDARDAARELYRACTAKGVAPPLAAQRVAAVFGVPSAYLGPYKALVTQPAVNPVVLADAADRALFGYVAKLVEVEGADVVVSKATRDNPDTAYYDGRGNDGRFAPQIGGMDVSSWLNTQLTDEEVAVEEEAATPKVAERKEQRKIKTIGGIKGIKSIRQGPKVAEPKAAERTLAHPAERTQVERKQTERSVAERTRISRKVQEKLDRSTQRKPKSGAKPAPANVLKDIDSNGGPWEELDEQITIALPAYEAQRFMGQVPGVGTVRDPRVFRIGHLQQMAGSNVEEFGSKEYEDQLVKMADDITGPDSAVAPMVHRIRSSDLAQMTHSQEQAFKMNLSRRMVARIENGMEIVDPNEVDEVQWVSDPHSDDALLVYYPDWKTNAEQDTLDTVYEFRITDGARGRQEGGRHKQYELDPNQAYKIVNPLRPHQHYDQAKDLWRTIYDLVAVDEVEVEEVRRRHNISKATQDDPRTAYYDARAADGRFMPTGQSVSDWLNEQLAVEHAPTRAKKQRKIKTIRSIGQPAKLQPTGRVAQPLSRPVERKQAGRKVSERTQVDRKQAVRTKLIHSVLAPVSRKQKESGPALSKSRNYSVLSKDSIRDLMEYMGPIEVGDRVDLDYPIMDALAESGVLTAPAADDSMRDHVNDHIFDELGDDLETDPLVFTATVDDSDDEAVDKFGEKIRSIMDRNPKASLMEISHEGYTNEGFLKVQVTSPMIKAAPLALVEYDQELDPADGSHMIYLGLFKSHRLQRDYGQDDMSETLSPYSAPVHVFRLKGTTYKDRR